MYLYDLVDDKYCFLNLMVVLYILIVFDVWLFGLFGESVLFVVDLGVGYMFVYFINGEGGEDMVRQYKR